jgi:hypothetical protein
MVIGLLYSFEIQNATTSLISNYQQPVTLPTSSIEVNPPPCITNPDIQFFMYHYVRAYDPRDNIFTTDLSVEPKNFKTHMQYIQELRKE